MRMLGSLGMWRRCTRLCRCDRPVPKKSLKRREARLWRREQT